MAELVDAEYLQYFVFKDVRVQVQLWAPFGVYIRDESK